MARTEIERRLDSLEEDFEHVTGGRPEHFYCPILYRDETAEIVRGHVIPQAFEGADRTWVPQRKDVESFFGTLFEAEFQHLQVRGQRTLLEILSDKDLSRELRPEISVDQEVIDYFQPSGNVPEQFSRVVLEGPEGSDAVELALKLEPSELVARLEGDWEIAYEKDLRLPALVSLLKSAHLTLFAMLGYRYVFSAAGRYVGYSVLGKFVRENFGEDRAIRLKNAESHFQRFSSIVRPITGRPATLSGTISDGVLHLCYDGNVVWGFLVLVRTGRNWNGIVLPTMSSPRAIDRYLSFVEAPSPKIKRRLAMFDEKNEKWLVHPEDGFIDWPGGSGW